MRAWARDLVVALGLAMVIIVFFYQPVKVEGTSMAPLLSDQERIFINKFVYRFEPIERGDVVVFWYPLDRTKSFIKRVVGLPGDLVEIREGHVYINGQLLEEPYVPPRYVDYSGYGPARVPAGRVFRDGRSPDQLQRFAHFRSRAGRLHLWQGGLCLLAGDAIRRDLGVGLDRRAGQMNAAQKFARCNNSGLSTHPEPSEGPLTETPARPATLALEDGRIFNGRAAGAQTRRGGEVVFNTSLTGYQEVFSDPSYSGQIVCLTYPHIGNVGANADDQESERPYIESLMVREFSQLASNWRSTETAQQYLSRHNVPVIWDLDTRALVRHIRSVGALRGVVATDGTPAEQLVAEAKALPTMAGLELASRVTREKPQHWTKGSIELTASPWHEGWPRPRRIAKAERFRVVAYDFGIKQNILRLLVDLQLRRHRGAGANLGRRRAGAAIPTACFSRTGRAIPSRSPMRVEAIRKLMGRVPVFGICLGHQLCGLALGGRTYKLKFGHHGSNHPVKNLLTGHVEITAQNHGFVRGPGSLPSSDVEITHVNLNDGTNEGMRHRSLPFFSVQYHPEASPGPHDSHYLFRQFTDMMNESRLSKAPRRGEAAAAKPAKRKSAE